ncbi:MAG: cache domain-containing protein [Methanocorpusculum sp.]|nr:cache domain-containing protein [Methanocorpusculum sp.]
MILVLTAVSGCISPSASSLPSTSPVEPSSAMVSAQLSIISDIKEIDMSISMDMYNLANKIGGAKSPADVRTLALEYYGENAWIEKLIYYDLATGERTRVPELSNDMYMTDYLPIPSQSELEAAGGVLHLDCVYIPGDGYVSANYAAVYSGDGRFKGLLILVYDMYVVLNINGVLSDSTEYGGYGCFILDRHNTVVFSTTPEYIGVTVTEAKPLYTGISFIQKSESKTGAYKYTSSAFYNYLRGTTTEKVTAWQQFVSYKSTYTLYLVEELNQQAMQYKDTYSVDVQQTMDAVVDAYVYAVSHSKEDALKKISNGEFSPYLCAMDREGNILAITTPESIGMNYMNNRDAYGVSYTEAMIYTAEQGGGYVYYSYPVDWVVTPAGSQFSIGYILSVNDEWFIFGRFAGDSDVGKVNLDLRKDVTDVSRTMVEKAYKSGVDSVIDMINTNPGATGSLFVKGLSHTVSVMGVIDTTGVVYAHSLKPSLVGTVQTGYTDVYGGSTARKMIMMAKAGGGLLSDLTQSTTDPSMVNLWLYSIEPIDTTHFVMTGIIIGTYRDYLSEFLKPQE